MSSSEEFEFLDEDSNNEQQPVVEQEADEDEEVIPMDEDDEEEFVEPKKKPKKKPRKKAKAKKADEEPKEAPKKRPKRVVEIPPRFLDIAARKPEGARLVIQYIEMENFKSYAGVKLVGPFHRSFSAVVGPNGSGKSNVIDSLLFVFGKRAAQLRFKKLSELIHKSDNYQDLGKARVSVHFQYIVDDDENDRAVPVEDCVFKVSRVVTRSGASSYYLDDDKSNWGEVTTVLKAQGIDLDHNRFLILQGEVEQIALMKPKGTTENEEGLLEYLEDIIGSNVLVESINEAEVTLLQCEEELSKAMARNNFEQKELAKLSDLRDEAMDHFRRLTEMVELESILTRLDLSLCSRQLLAKQSGSEKAIEAAKELKEQLKEAEQQFKGARELNSKERKVYDSAIASREKAKSAVAQLERAQVKLQGEEKHLKQAEKKLVKKKETLTKKVEDKRTLIKELEASAPSWEQDLKELEDDHKVEDAKLSEMYNELKGDAAQLRVQLDGKQNELLPWTKEINEKRSAVDVAQSELSLAEESANAGRVALERTEAELENLTGELEELRVEHKELVHAEKSLKSQVPKLAKQLESLKGQEVEVTQQLREAREQYALSASQMDDDRAGSKLIKLLLAAQTKNKLSGVFGRLGELGGIPSKYDVAISTACPALNNIVVQDTRNAERCVKLLKIKKAGRATFTVLDKMERWKSESQKKITTPEGVPRLFDLVNVEDERVLTAMYHAMRDTLVCDTMEQAARISAGDGRQRWRVVTLDGKLYDKAGTISGGGSRVVRGLMGAKAAHSRVTTISREDVELLKQKGSELAAAVGEVSARVKEVEAELEQKTAEWESAQDEIPRIQMKISSYESRVEELQSQLPELRRGVDVTPEDQQQLDSLQQQLDSATTALEKVHNKTRRITEEIAELKDSLENIGGPALKKQKAKVETLTKQIEDGAALISKSKVQSRAALKASAKLEKELQSNDKELAKVLSDLEHNEHKVAELEKKFADEKQRFDETNAVAAEKEKHWRKNNKEEERLKHSITELKSSIVQGENAMEDLRIELNAIEARKTALGQKLEIETQKKLDLWLNMNPLSEEPPEGCQDHLIVELDAEELSQQSKSTIKAQVAKLKNKTENSNVHNGAIKEFEEKSVHCAEVRAQYEMAKEEMKKSRGHYDDLRAQRHEMFMTGFGQINTKLKEMYRMITMGDGMADLECKDAMDPFAEGIEFTAKPPKKTWKAITNLSGGEKTLSSLALVFALHHYKPTPLYVMDEIDAALDFRNVSIVGNYIKERTKNQAQFIVISLRNQMFELADRLVGIYKTDNNTKSVTINPRSFNVPGGDNVVHIVKPVLARTAATQPQHLMAPPSPAAAPSMSPSPASPTESASGPATVPFVVEEEEEEELPDSENLSVVAGTPSLPIEGASPARKKSRGLFPPNKVGDKGKEEEEAYEDSSSPSMMDVTNHAE